MPINAGIMNALVRPVRSVQDYQDDYTRRDMQQQGIQRNALMLQEGQALQQDRERSRMEQDGLNNALRMLGPGATPEQVIKAARGVGNRTGYDFADTREKSWLERQKSLSAIGKDDAATADARFKLSVEKQVQGLKTLQIANDPSHAAALIDGLVRNEIWTAADAEMFISRMPQDAQQFAQWKPQQLAPALAADKLLPTNGHVGLGGSMGFTSTNPLTGAVTMTGNAPITQDANSIASTGVVLQPNGAPAKVDEGVLRAKSRVAHAGATTVNTYGSPVPFNLPDGSIGYAQPGNRAGAPPQIMEVGGKPLSKPAGAEHAPSEGERKAATLLQRMRFSANQIAELTGGAAGAGMDTPDKLAATLSVLPVVGNVASRAANPQSRRIIEDAQLDVLDAALTLGTGAAYTREQLEGYRKSYFPQVGDTPVDAKSKRERLANVLKAGETQAGRAAKGVPEFTPAATPASPPKGVKFLGFE